MNGPPYLAGKMVDGGKRAIRYCTMCRSCTMRQRPIFRPCDSIHGCINMSLTSICSCDIVKITPERCTTPQKISWLPYIYRRVVQRLWYLGWHLLLSPELLVATCHSSGCLRD